MKKQVPPIVRVPEDPSWMAGPEMFATYRRLRALRMTVIMSAADALKDDPDAALDERAYRIEKRRAEARARVEAERRAAASPAATWPRARPMTDVMKDRPTPAVVEDLLWDGCVTTITSEPNRGKTFVALDIAAHVAQGKAWHGRRARRGAVVLVEFESDDIGKRMRGLATRGHDVSVFYALPVGQPISPRVGRDGVEEVSIGEAQVSEALSALAADLEKAEAPPIVLIIIDTVRASLAGSEDSSEHVSAYLRAVRKIMGRAPGAACLLLHHSGWQDGDTKRKRERGSSAFRGNVEAAFYLDAAGDGYLELTATKVKDAAFPDPLALRLMTVDVPVPENEGARQTTCVVVGVDRETAAKAKREQRETEDHALDVLVLRVMPKATNRRDVRVHTGKKYDDVSAAIDRVLRAGWATAGKRGEPFQVTAAGLEVLEREDHGL